MYPRFLEIEITGQCTYQCLHCYGAFPVAGELSRETVAGVVDAAQGLFDCVILSGGEPLLHPDLPDMVDAASRNFVVFITTSGYGLSPALLERLQNRAILVFGLDGIAQTHDRYRGRPGAFATLLRALAMTRQLPKEIIVTLWREALPQIDSIIALAEQYNAIVHFNGLIPVGRARNNPGILPDPAELAAAGEKLYRLKKGGGSVITDLHRVTAKDRETGINLFCKGRYNITPAGDVRPCEFHYAVLGSIYRQPLRSIIAAARDTELIRSREDGFRQHIRCDLENPFDYHTSICHRIAGGADKQP
jgi:MoaA/NifB/PqqE/SkfB family radical SAM enzyme